MNKICTSIEQSKKLMELGIDVKTADMSYSFNFNSETYELSTVPYKDWIVPKYAKSDKFEQVIPAWSLSALLKMIGDYTMQTDTLFRHFIVCDRERYITENYNEPLDAAFEMACRLLEIKKHNHE